jgi:hypothetical protein
MDCSVCFETIDDTTGHVKMGCAHLFHFRCIAHWFTQQASNDLPQNCPCCRREGSPLETFPELPDEEADSEDEESYVTDDGEELCLNRAELDALLRAQGGTGVSDAFWRSFFEDDDEEHYQDATITLPFSQRELGHYLIAQGGRPLSDEEWDRALDAGGDAPEAAEAAVPLAIESFRGWRRVGEGRWERMEVLNPEEDLWDGVLDAAEMPPESLVLQMSEAATKMKALWKGTQTRERFSAARSLLALARA